MTTLGGLKMIAERSLWPIIGSLFHPVYMMVNARVLGGIHVDSELCAALSADDPSCISAKRYLAAFGLGSSTLSIVMIATAMCFTIGLSNVIP